MGGEIMDNNLLILFRRIIKRISAWYAFREYFIL